MCAPVHIKGKETMWVIAIIKQVTINIVLKLFIIDKDCPRFPEKNMYMFVFYKLVLTVVVFLWQRNLHKMLIRRRLLWWWREFSHWDQWMKTLYKKDWTIQYVVDKKSRELFLQEKLKTGLNDPFFLPNKIGYSNKKLQFILNYFLSMQIICWLFYPSNDYQWMILQLYMGIYSNKKRFIIYAILLTNYV